MVINVDFAIWKAIATSHFCTPDSGCQQFKMGRAQGRVLSENGPGVRGDINLGITNSDSAQSDVIGADPN